MFEKSKHAISLLLAGAFALTYALTAASCDGGQPSETNGGNQSETGGGTNADAGTSSIDTSPTEGYVTVEENGCEYAIYDDHSALLAVTSTVVSIPDEVEGKPLTNVVEGAFDHIDKPQAVVCGSADSPVYDFCVENDILYYAYYEGGDIVANVPGHPDTLPEAPIPTYLQGRMLTDENDKLNSLVKSYLADGSGRDELFELVITQCVNAGEFMMCEWSTAAYYDGYNAKTRTVAMFDGEYRLCEKVRYGDIDTYDELESFVRLHFADKIADEVLHWCLNVNGELFHVIDRQFRLELDPHIKSPVASFDVSEDRIVMTVRRGVYTPEEEDGKVTEVFTGEYRTAVYTLENDGGIWRWGEDSFATENLYAGWESVEDYTIE